MRFISRAARFPSSGKGPAARLISSTSGCTFTAAIFCSGIRRCRWVRWRPRNAWSSCALWRTGFVSASWKRSTSRWVWIRRRIWKGCPGCSTLQSYREGEMAKYIFVTGGGGFSFGEGGGVGGGGSGKWKGEGKGEKIFLWGGGGSRFGGGGVGARAARHHPPSPTRRPP